MAQSSNLVRCLWFVCHLLGSWEVGVTSCRTGGCTTFALQERGPPLRRVRKDVLEVRKSFETTLGLFGLSVRFPKRTSLHSLLHPDHMKGRRVRVSFSYKLLKDTEYESLS